MIASARPSTVVLLSAISSPLCQGSPDLQCLIPVSYTHLDVYKRQEMLSIGLINDMYSESRNDDYKYAELATQEDFDRF